MEMTFSIGQVVERTSVSMNRIREWQEKNYLPEACWITVGGRQHRRFTEKDVQVIDKINRLQEEGDDPAGRGGQGDRVVASGSVRIRDRCSSPVQTSIGQFGGSHHAGWTSIPGAKFSKEDLCAHMNDLEHALDLDIRLVSEYPACRNITNQLYQEITERVSFRKTNRAKETLKLGRPQPLGLIQDRTAGEVFPQQE